MEKCLVLKLDGVVNIPNPQKLIYYATLQSGIYTSNGTVMDTDTNARSVAKVAVNGATIVRLYTIGLAQYNKDINYAVLKYDSSNTFIGMEINAVSETDIKNGYVTCPLSGNPAFIAWNLNNNNDSKVATEKNCGYILLV